MECIEITQQGFLDHARLHRGRGVSKSWHFQNSVPTHKPYTRLITFVHNQLPPFKPLGNTRILEALLATGLNSGLIMCITGSLGDQNPILNIKYYHHRGINTLFCRILLREGVSEKSTYFYRNQLPYRTKVLDDTRRYQISFGVLRISWLITFSSETMHEAERKSRFSRRHPNY